MHGVPHLSTTDPATPSILVKNHPVKKHRIFQFQAESGFPPAQRGGGEETGQVIH